MPKIFSRILGLALIVSVLAGCQTVRSNVTTFHTLTPSKPQTFSVAASSGYSLEANTYADLIADALIAEGWSRSERPDVKVVFNYSVDNGRTVVGSVPVFGQTGGGTTYHSGSVYGRGGYGSFSGTSYTPATYGVVGSAPTTEIIFTRNLKVTMTDQRTGKSVFEGQVISAGSNSTFSAVAPCMINALFEGFPGDSGKTKSIEVDASKCEAR